MNQSRVILYHKQSTSGRTRFLRYAHGGVCGPEPLPALAQLLDAPEGDADISLHPAAIIAEAGKSVGVAAGDIEVDGEFDAWLDIAGGPVQVFLARFTAIDPPFAEVEQHDARFIELTAARGMAPAELELLRKAYESIMEG